MAKRLIPSLNRVLIEKIVPPSKTNSGILLPEKTTKVLIELLLVSFLDVMIAVNMQKTVLNLNSGKVVAVGPGARDRNGNLIPVSVKEGDVVLLPEYGGTEVKLGDKEYHLFRDDDILGTVHE
ncbi:10 kDa chaperonin [Cocos nucifera]|uniref:10 kDa chaperonin n=1 Tax=Cocos nucifera TaxID=13894 RepID=A0A8K0N047_COCNU|nr:10 kDa chaperonin [Cocos nucifera]